MTISHAAALVFMLALAACRSPDGNVAANQAVAADAATAADQPLPPTNSVEPPATSDTTQPATIPAALHGRWGLVPGDCTSTRGDAKGLVTISEEEIRFYESVARPAKIVERTDRVIRGEFDFIGEGMEWTNYMTWSVTGDRLTRVDSEPDSRLVYSRC